MPTEAEIEAAARKICADLDGNPDDRAQGIEDGRLRWSWYADTARAALTAAEEVRGQAVPDEAAIRADERERCATWHDEQSSGFKGAYETAQDSGRDYAWSRYLWHAGAAKAIRAAAPKP